MQPESYQWLGLALERVGQLLLYYCTLCSPQLYWRLLMDFKAAIKCGNIGFHPLDNPAPLS